jgi:hypothetical protein
LSPPFFFILDSKSKGHTPAIQLECDQERSKEYSICKRKSMLCFTFHTETSTSSSSSSSSSAAAPLLRLYLREKNPDSPVALATVFRSDRKGFDGVVLDEGTGVPLLVACLFAPLLSSASS